MEYTAIGNIYQMGETVKRTETFRIREVVLEMDGAKKTQYVKFQFVQDACNRLDMFNEGDKVKIEFNLTGQYHEASDRFYTNLTAFRISSQGTSRANAPASRQGSVLDTLYGDSRGAAQA